MPPKRAAKRPASASAPRAATAATKRPAALAKKRPSAAAIDGYQRLEAPAFIGSSRLAADPERARVAEDVVWTPPATDNEEQLADLGGVDPAALAELRQQVIDVVETGLLPMFGLMVIKDGTLLLSVAADRLPDQTGLTPRRLLRIYSMTKAVVSIAALKLVEDGMLKLESRVSDCLPYWSDELVRVRLADGGTEPASRPIVVRDLLCHTAGLTYGYQDNEVSRLYREEALELPHPLFDHRDAKKPPCRSLKEFATRLNSIPLVAQPGTEFHYSVSIDLLGCVIEEVSGMPLGGFLEQSIFKPLDMPDTSFTISREELHRLVPCYLCTGPAQYKLASFPLYNIGSVDDTTPWLVGREQGMRHSGGGGLLSTVRDYMRLVECLTRGGALEDGSGRLLQAETLELMTRDHLAEIGVEPARRASLFENWGFKGHGLMGGVTTGNAAGVAAAAVAAPASVSASAAPAAPPGGDHMPGADAAGAGTTAWGGIACTYFFSDPVNRLSCIQYSQALDYWVGAPTVRKSFAHAVYRLFPGLRERLCPEEEEAA